MPLARSGAHSISHFDAPLLGPSFSTNQLGTPETQSRGSGVRAPTMLRNTWLSYKRIQFLPIHWNSGRDRLYAALLEKQNSDRCANSILGFITQVMNPVRRPVLRRLGCRGFGLRPIPTGITLKHPSRGCQGHLISRRPIRRQRACAVHQSAPHRRPRNRTRGANHAGRTAEVRVYFPEKTLHPHRSAEHHPRRPQTNLMQL